MKSFFCLYGSQRQTGQSGSQAPVPLWDTLVSNFLTLTFIVCQLWRLLLRTTLAYTVVSQGKPICITKYFVNLIL